jgi:hypothetical protein
MGGLIMMDVLFLIDATGSMGHMIHAAHAKASDIANNLRSNNPNVDFQFGSVCYRDPIDSPQDIHEVHQLNPDINALVSFLSGIQAVGGGDTPEDWAGAYMLALEAIKWRKGAKTIIHIADAPAHGEHYSGFRTHEEESHKLAPLIRSVAEQGILISCIDINTGAARSFNACKEIYEQSGGRKFTVENLIDERYVGKPGDCDEGESFDMEDARVFGAEALEMRLQRHVDFACAKALEFHDI